jgi:hypothetical protein
MHGPGERKCHALTYSEIISRCLYGIPPISIIWEVFEEMTHNYHFADRLPETAKRSFLNAKTVAERSEHVGYMHSTAPFSEPKRELHRFGLPEGPGSMARFLPVCQKLP